MLAIEKSQGDLEAEQLLECDIVMAGGVTSGIIYRTIPEENHACDPDRG
jgi:hypothetical protein